MSSRAAEQTAEALESIGQHQDSEGAEYRILGPPGCGKTTNTARQVRRAVEKYGENSVLVTSFSRTAAAELAGRELPIPPSQVGTLHSHCYRALGHPEIAESRVEEWNAANPSMVITQQGKAERMDDGGDDGTGSRDGDHLLEEMSRLRGLMMERDFWPPAVRHFASKWEDYKSANGLLDFTDLIEVCLRDTSMAPGAPSVLFADEAQDLTRMMAALVRRWGQWARHYVVVGDDDQCQPAGTMVETAAHGEVAIEELDHAVHRLRSYSKADSIIYGSPKNGYSFSISDRHYDGLMYKVACSSGRTTRATKNHHWLVRWNKQADGIGTACCVYLMRKGAWFRIGWCQLFNAEGILHFSARARLEGADDAWILKTFKSRTDASVYESQVAALFGLPLVTFKQIHNAKHYSEQSLREVFEYLGEDRMLKRAAQCLAAHDLSLFLPMYVAGKASKFGSRIFECHTANLLPEWMLLPVPATRGSGRAVYWDRFTVSKEPFRGTVYSLNVDKHHTYIADGVITHNCIFGFTGADPDVLIDPPIPERNIIVLKQSYRVPVAVHAEAVRWIKAVRRRQEKEYFPRPFPGKVERLAVGTWENPGDPVLRLLEKHLNEGQSVMFLASCTYQLRPLIKMLRDRGWPFHNPYRRSNGAWNPIRVGKAGTAANRILALLAAHPDMGPDQRRWTRQDVAAWADWLKAEGIMKRGKKKSLHDGDMHQLVTEQDLDDIFTVSALDELLASFEGDRGALLDWWLRRLDSAAHARCEFPVAVAKRHGPEALTEPPRIIVGTIHSVKGGEADVVVMWPDLSVAGALEYGRAGSSRDSVIRQFYVGMTRAREVLYIGQRATSQAVII